MLFAGPPSARAQGCTPQGVVGSISATLNVTPCVQVTAPQNRKFVIFTLSESYEHWQSGAGCQSHLLGDCGNALSLQVSIGPIGFSYTLAGSVGTAPPGGGWTDVVGNPICVDPACAQCESDEVAAIDACNMDQACIQQAQATFVACQANLAHDRMVVSARQSFKVLPLPPGLTSGGSVTLTMSTASTGNVPLLGNLLTLAAGLNSDTRFTMNQTPSPFRPRDARDPAANCIAADQNGQTHDGDCHPRYTVQFVCGTSLPSHAGNSLTPALLLASAGAWRLPSLFARPRGRLGTGPIALFVSAPPPPCPNPPVLYQFQLAKQTDWLPGTSTNFGADTAADPDYLFEQGNVPGYNVPLNTNLAAPQNGGLSIATPGFVTTPQNVTVTSRDFGGTARLRATATLQDGQTFDADVVDANGDAVPVPSGACGGAFAQHPFASIPVDQDCNGIADSWEDANSNQNGAHLPPDWDKEPGTGANSPLGDGYSVHDEYRGFHYMFNDGNTPQWTSTDPMKTFDVFFWDRSNRFTAPLRQILDRQNPDPNNPKFKYRRVNAAQANAFEQNKPTRGAKFLNKNSITLRTQEGYAVVYAEDSLGRDTNDRSHQLLGVTPSLDGSNGTPIRIDPKAIDDFARSVGFPQPTLIAEVVAHETGHRFTRPHPVRQNCCNYISLPVRRLRELTPSQFAFPGSESRDVYVRLAQYTANGRTVVGDSLYLDPVGRSNSGQTPQTNDSPDLPVYKISLDRPLSSTNSHLLVMNQLLELMDWTPNLTLTAPGQWHFDPADLAKLCVRRVCVCPSGQCQ